MGWEGPLAMKAPPPNPEIPDPKYAQRMLNGDDRKFHLMGMAGLESNGTSLCLLIMIAIWAMVEESH